MEDFVRAIATEGDRSPGRSRRSGFVSIVVLALFSSWWHASAFLSRYGRFPLDGTSESFLASLAFAGVGLVIGVSVAHAFLLSRNLFARTALSGLSAAVSVTLLVELVGVEAFSILSPVPEPDATLLAALSWGLYLGAPVAAGAAFSIHLLRRTSGKLRLTLIVCLLSVLAGIQSERLFWEHWDYLTRSGLRLHCAGDWDPTPGWLIGMVGAIALCFGTLALDLGARLSAPGTVRTILERLRLHLGKGGAS